MTSTSGGDAGKSYGWINYKLVESGKPRPTFILLVVKIVSGWDRRAGSIRSISKKMIHLIWSLANSFTDWYRIFWISSSDSSQAVYQKKSSITNYSGFTFDLDIERKIQLLDSIVLAKELDLSPSVNFVAYQTENTIRNSGTKDWKKETGLLSIWILGMFQSIR